MLEKQFVRCSAPTDGGDTGTPGTDADKSEPGPVPYPRFHERNEVAKKYESLGYTPEQIETIVQDYWVLSEQNEQLKAKASQKKETPKEKTSSLPPEKA